MSNSPEKTTVLLIDDHAVVREGLAVQIEADSDITVVGQAGNAEDGLDLVDRLEPDVVLMDVELPGLSSFAAAGNIVSQHPEVRIIFLSAYSHDMYIEQALQVRAWGYLTKSEPSSVVRQAIRDVKNGWVHFSSEVKGRIVSGPDGPRLAPRSSTRASRLTGRELELLRYVAQGMATKEIAEVMNISTKTVDNHKARIMAKLGIHDRVELARYAFREGIASP